MTIDPTRKEWLAVRDALVARIHFGSTANSADGVTEAALGCPCPPEPAPPPWLLGSLEVEDYPVGARGVWVGFAAGSHQKLTPDEADAMANALCEHAAYARKQGTAHADQVLGMEQFGISVTSERYSVCGTLLVGRPGDTWDNRCQRPKGHDGSHDVWPRPGDSYKACDG